jgi:outer membrane protein OmpA-like peptidoglycan-associated protein
MVFREDRAQARLYNKGDQMKRFSIFLSTLAFAFGVTLQAQVPNPLQQTTTTTVVAPVRQTQNASVPVFHVTVVSRTLKAINYKHRSGDSDIEFRGTPLLPLATGKAEVDSKMGSTKIETQVKNLDPASKFGPEYLTYVLWAITPEGRAQNLGELVIDDGKAKLLSTTELQAFGLMVTAEPYFAVTQPSDVVVMENVLTNDINGTVQAVDAKYELLQRGSYVMNSSNFRPVEIDHKGPLQLSEARNAVQLARVAGADIHAADTFQKALSSLQAAETQKGDRKLQESRSREAAQMAEDARIISIKKQIEIAAANERAEAAAREAAAKAAADAEASRRAAAEAARDQADAERRRADLDRRQAEAERLAADRAKQEAQAAQAAALAQQQAAQAEAERARLAADEANRARALAESEQADLRAKLQHQLNLILETRDTARGLIVNLSDVLFDTAKFTLKPGAREKLAKVSGIVLAYPGLHLAAEGHTDSVGSDEYNQTLSENRANSVRDFLVAQGIPRDNITAKGFGESSPVATNDSPAGRQQNRRVELVVSGEIIGAETVSGLR